MGKRQRDCVGCGAPVGHHRPGVLLSLHAPDARARRQGSRARTAAGPRAGRRDRPVRAVLAALHRVRSPVRRPGCHVVPDLPPQSRPPRASSGRARAAASPAICARRPAGAVMFPAAAHRRIRPRICAVCGQLRRHAGLRHVLAMLAAPPGSAVCRAASTWPPAWPNRRTGLRDFVAHLAARLLPRPGLHDDHRPGPAARATSIPTTRRQCSNAPAAPAARWARWPGRWRTSSPSAAWRCRPTMPSGSPPGDVNAASTPSPNRCDRPWRPSPISLLTARARARRAGTRPRSDHTIEQRWRPCETSLSFLERRTGQNGLGDRRCRTTSKRSLPRSPSHRQRRLTVLRQFFRFARTRRLVLVDPTTGLARQAPKVFAARTLTLDQQRPVSTLDHRSGRPPSRGAGRHPRAAAWRLQPRGPAAALPRHRPAGRTIRLGDRPHPVPLDPASWAVLQRCLAHRKSGAPSNPHVIVTSGTKAGREPASTAYLGHVLDACGSAADDPQHPPGRPGQHHGPQARRRSLRHGPPRPR